jgi:hypothetical protein
MLQEGQNYLDEPKELGWRLPESLKWVLIMGK